MHTHTHTHLFDYVLSCLRSCACAMMYYYTCTNMCVCVCVCVLYIHTYMHIRAYLHRHTHIHTLCCCHICRLVSIILFCLSVCALMMRCAYACTHAITTSKFPDVHIYENRTHTYLRVCYVHGTNNAWTINKCTHHTQVWLGVPYMCMFYVQKFYWEHLPCSYFLKIMMQHIHCALIALMRMYVYMFVCKHETHLYIVIF